MFRKKNRRQYRPDFNEWINEGMSRGWCGPPVCHTHDGLPLSDIESVELNEFDDICIHIVRLYSSDFEKFDVESDHSPSIWRKASYPR